MNYRRLLTVAVLLLSMVALSACASSPQDTGGQGSAAESVTPADLVGTWECYEFAVSSSPRTVLSSAPITAEFDSAGKLSGSAGVNTYSTTYTADGSNIKIDSAIATTKMAGPEDAMTQETNYLTTLPTAQSFNIVNGDLVLFGPAKNMIARYHPAQ